jgi:hypothetical protein
MIGGNANDFTEENDMVATIMLRVRSAFQPCCAPGQNRHTAFSRFEFHAFKLVHIAHGESAGQGRLVLAQDMNTKVPGGLKGCEVSRCPAERPENQGWIHGYRVKAVGGHAERHAVLVACGNNGNARYKQAKRVAKCTGIKFHMSPSKLVSLQGKADFPAHHAALTRARNAVEYANKRVPTLSGRLRRSRQAEVSSK